MSTPGLEGGWKKRREEAKRRKGETDERAAIRAERGAMAREQFEASMASAAAAAEREKLARCSCPVCDSGMVTIEQAERIITALAKLPAAAPVDQAVIAALSAVVRGRDITRNSVHADRTGLHVPRRVYAAAPEAEAAAPAPATVNPKQPVIPSTPRRKATAAELAAAAGDEGAIDLDD